MPRGLNGRWPCSSWHGRRRGLRCRRRRSGRSGGGRFGRGRRWTCRGRRRWCRCQGWRRRRRRRCRRAGRRAGREGRRREDGTGRRSDARAGFDGGAEQEEPDDGLAEAQVLDDRSARGIGGCDSVACRTCMDEDAGVRRPRDLQAPSIPPSLETAPDGGWTWSGAFHCLDRHGNNGGLPQEARGQEGGEGQERGDGSRRDAHGPWQGYGTPQGRGKATGDGKEEAAEQAGPAAVGLPSEGQEAFLADPLAAPCALGVGLA